MGIKYIVLMIKYKHGELTYNMTNIVLLKYKPSHITWRTSFL